MNAIDALIEDFLIEQQLGRVQQTTEEMAIRLVECPLPLLLNKLLTEEEFNSRTEEERKKTDRVLMLIGLLYLASEMGTTSSVGSVMARLIAKEPAKFEHIMDLLLEANALGVRNSKREEAKKNEKES